MSARANESLILETLIQCMTKETKAVNSEILAEYIVDGIREKKGQHIVKVDLRGHGNAVSDFFVICHGSSDRQVDAIADSIVETVRDRCGDRPNTVEGKQNAEWILLDYVDVVVHVFQEKLRDLYSIEDLWADVPIEQIGD